MDSGTQGDGTSSVCYSSFQTHSMTDQNAQTVVGESQRGLCTDDDDWDSLAKRAAGASSAMGALSGGVRARSRGCSASPGIAKYREQARKRQEQQYFPAVR